MTKRKIRAKLTYPLNVQDPQQLLCLLFTKTYFAGKLNRNIPNYGDYYKELERLILYYNDK